MNDRDDPHLEAVERRLADRAGTALPPRLRDRVLAAVRDALAEKAEKAPATTSGQSPQAAYPFFQDVVAGTSIPGWAWAVAVVVGIGLTGFVVGGMEAVRRRELPTLAAHLRAAGLVDDSLVFEIRRDPLPRGVGGPVGPTPMIVPPRPDQWSRDVQRLLEETL